MPKMSATSFADEATESIINGNVSDVIEQLDRLPKRQGLAAVALICHRLRDNDYSLIQFQNRLTDRL